MMVTMNTMMMRLGACREMGAASVGGTSGLLGRLPAAPSHPHHHRHRHHRCHHRHHHRCHLVSIFIGLLWIVTIVSTFIIIVGQPRPFIIVIIVYRSSFNRHYRFTIIILLENPCLPIAKDCLLTGQEQACIRITRLSFCCHHAENGLIHGKMAVDCPLVITSIVETRAEKSEFWKVV